MNRTPLRKKSEPIAPRMVIAQTKRDWKDHEAFASLTRPHDVVRDQRLCRRLACSNTLPKRRQYWCSDECIRIVDEQTIFAFARRSLFKREQGVCRQCGLNTIHLRRMLENAYTMFVRLQGSVEANLTMRRVHLLINAPVPNASGWGGDVYVCSDLWNADHIVPLAEGGKLCDPDNLRTLCVWCHRKETSLLAARLAKTRRVASKHAIGYVPLRFQS